MFSSVIRFVILANFYNNVRDNEVEKTFVQWVHIEIEVHTHKGHVCVLTTRSLLSPFHKLLTATMGFVCIADESASEDTI